MFGKNEKVLVAVSGGKDSLSLWDILVRLGYQADGLYIGLGIDGGFQYSNRSKELCFSFANKNGLILHTIDLEEEYNRSIQVMANVRGRTHQKPCSVCGIVKRHEMNRIAKQLGYDVLATGHNLDDEAATLFGNTLSWNQDLIIRQFPVLPESHGLSRKVKPLCRFYEKEMAAYAILRNIEYIYDECPFSIGSSSIYYKELLNRLENERPGSKLAFYVKFLNARADGLFREVTQPNHLNPDQNCEICGQPTTNSTICAFCKIMRN